MLLSDVVMKLLKGVSVGNLQMEHWVRAEYEGRSGSSRGPGAEIYVWSDVAHRETARPIIDGTLLGTPARSFPGISSTFPSARHAAVHKAPPSTKASKDK